MTFDLEAQVRALADRAAISDLIDRYQLALDDGMFDNAWARAVFAPDVVLDFPPGSHHGVAGLTEFTSGFMRHWARTHHHASNYVIGLAGHEATVSWNVIASHVHHDSPLPPAQGKQFHLGGRFDGDAIRTADGWRLRRLTLRVVWTAGIGIPSIAATMAEARE